MKTLIDPGKIPEEIFLNSQTKRLRKICFEFQVNPGLSYLAFEQLAPEELFS